MIRLSGPRGGFAVAVLALVAFAGAALAGMAKLTGKTFGDPANPLLVSVRSGARASMPGMMDTVLNLGLDRLVVETQHADAILFGRDRDAGNERNQPSVARQAQPPRACTP